MRKGLISALGALAVACPTMALAEPLTLDTLLGLETFGRVAIDPSGQVAIIEERRARNDLPRYDLQPEGALRYARLYRFDVSRPADIRPLLPMDDDAGYTSGPFSPDGSRMVVFRLQGLSFRLGVVELDTGAVTWTDLSPETGAWGRSVQWISPEAFLVLAMPDGGLPPRLADLIATQTQLPGLWARAARGEAAFVSVGQGAPAEDPPGRTLWRVSAETGAKTALVAGAFLDFEASPDGRHVALIEDGPVLDPPAPDKATEFRRARSLHLVGTQGGENHSPEEAVDISTSLLAWSPDSDRLLVTGVGTEPARLLVVTTSGDSVDRTPADVLPDTATDMFGSPTTHAGWLGDIPIVRGARDGRMAWWLQHGDEVSAIPGLSEAARVIAQGRQALLFTDRGRTLRLRPDLSLENLGATAAAARDDGPLGHRVQTDSMGSETVAVAPEAGRLCRVHADGDFPPQCVDADPGSSISWTRGVSLRIGTDNRALNQLEVRHGGSMEVVRRLNPELDSVDVPAPHLVTGPDGARGWLYLPKWSEAGPPPVIVIPYPGRIYPTPPRNMRPETVQMTLNGALLVAAGYAVLYPDLPATAEPSDGLADRILAIVDAAGADGRIDVERIGLWGHSFGAWAVVLSTTQSPRFKAVVAVNGSHNLQLSLAGLSPHQRLRGENTVDAIGASRWLETGQAGMLRAYWSDPERYRRASAFERAERIAAPILFFHGEMDFSAGQAEQMYAALVRLQKPAALTYLFGEDHSIHNPGNARVYYDQLTAWFDLYLKSEAPQSSPPSSATRPRSAPE